MYSLLFFFMIVSFIQLQIIESKTCVNFETDVDFNEDDITPIPTNGNLDSCVIFCASLPECTGFTYENSTTNCYIKKFTEPTRISFIGRISCVMTEGTYTTTTKKNDAKVLISNVPFILFSLLSIFQL